ncbi:ABC transporter permease [Dactylosporangium fulvum]|uniref:ABC transporter permease n=1 Tax=Dactylosporangium fulvum TaxID=53359 RepID=A0ABY5W6E6_9ACTN|nr:ABC transporter permease [Dactylosporangium fulvum]UWP85628.1 ABC transporter permease [Dactylosporangium fulvum]
MSDRAGREGAAARSAADALMDRPVEKASLLRRRPELLLSPAVLVLVLAVWHLVVQWFEVSRFVLPPPVDVIQALVRNIQEGRYTDHLLYTVRNSLTGFAAGTILGVLVGGLLAASSIVERVLHPYIVAFQTFPKIALVPMLTIWFGFDAQPKMIIAGILAFFPVMVNAYVGLTSLDVESEELMRSLRSSRLQTFVKLRLPTALPYIFAGLELALVFAILGAVTGEFLGSRQGLGFLIQQFSAQLRTEDIFALLIIFAILGMAVHMLISWLRKKVIYWQG